MSVILKIRMKCYNKALSFFMLKINTKISILFIIFKCLPCCSKNFLTSLVVHQYIHQSTSKRLHPSAQREHPVVEMPNDKASNMTTRFQFEKIFLALAPPHFEMLQQVYGSSVELVDSIPPNLINRSDSSTSIP